MTKLSMIVTILASLIVIFLGYKLFNSFDVNTNTVQTNSVIDGTAKDLVSPIMKTPTETTVEEQ